MQKIKFEQDKEKILKQLSLLGSYVLNNVSESFDAVESFDKDAIERIERDEKIINNMRDSILQRNLLFITRHQPLARDLRFIEAANTVTREYERLGDFAVDIMKQLKFLNNDIKPDLKKYIMKAADHAMHMVEDSINAFNSNTKAGAEQVFPKEIELNTKFYELKEKIIEEMVNCDKIKIVDLVVCLFIVKYIERIGDHAQNISKAILFRKGE